MSDLDNTEKKKKKSISYLFEQSFRQAVWTQKRIIRDSSMRITM